MTETASLPLRVLVRGASTVGWAGVMGGPRTDLGFPRVIEREVLAAGRPVEIRTFTRGGMPTSHIVRTWEDDVVGFSPDVVVYMVGHYETLHSLWPNWLERHANNFTWLPRPSIRFYRKRLMRPAWRALVKAQTLLDTKVPTAITTRRLRNAIADIAHVVTQVRTVQSPLVVLMETPLPAAPAQRLFPAMEQRARLFNTMLGELVDTLNAGAQGAERGVRLFRTNAVLDAAHPADRLAALPDGFHFSPQTHDLVGRALGEEILTWAEKQPHLQPFDVRR